MSKQISKKPVALAMGAALAGGLIGAGTANAAENPFGLSELGGGYMQVADNGVEGKCGGQPKPKPAAEEGKCGGQPQAKPAAEEGKCGGQPQAKPAAEEGKCGGQPVPKPMPKMKDGNCGEAKCGGNMR